MIPPLVVIVGPTGSGKSDLALDIARRFGGEIICADSRTVYKGMDIGTGKPSSDDQKEVKHHLLDLVTPDKVFTVADFQRAAVGAINDIASRGKLPLLVGGSGLYVDSVIFNYRFGRRVPEKEREELNAMSVTELQARLKKRNLILPENAGNKRHLVRALELGGLLQHPRVLRENTIVVGITINAAPLQKRLEDRARRMLERGVLHEAKELAEVYGWDCEPMKSNIYRILKTVKEDTRKEEVVKAVVAADQRLVKKQGTWFKRNPNIRWGTPAQSKKRIEDFIKSLQ